MWKTWLLLVLIVVAVPIPAATEGIELSDERTYSSDHYHLVVRLPAGWQVNEGAVLDKDFERLVEASHGGASLAITVIDLYPELHSEDSRTWSTRQEVDRRLVGNEQQLLQGLLEELGAAHIETTWEVVSLAGWPAGRLRAVRAAGDTGQERQDIHVVIHNGTAFTITTWTPRETSPEGETLAAALASLQIVRQYTETPPGAARKAVPLAAGTLFTCLVCLVPWVGFLVAGRRRARLRRRAADGGDASAPIAPLVLIGGASPDLATVGQRLLTFILDQLVLTPLSLALGWLFGITVAVAAELAGVEAPPERVLNLAGALPGLAVLVTYYGCAEGLWGRTVGKLVAGTRAVRADGSAVGFAVACTRALCRLIPLDALSFLGRGGTAGWHDRFTGTRVISVRPRKKPSQAEASAMDAAGESPATSSGT